MLFYKVVLLFNIEIIFSVKYMNFPTLPIKGKRVHAPVYIHACMFARTHTYIQIFNGFRLLLHRKESEKVMLLYQPTDTCYC